VACRKERGISLKKKKEQNKGAEKKEKKVISSN